MHIHSIYSLLMMLTLIKKVQCVAVCCITHDCKKGANSKENRRTLGDKYAKNILQISS